MLLSTAFLFVSAFSFLSRLSSAVVNNVEKSVTIPLKKRWDYFNCSLLFHDEDCIVDPRQGFIDHYKKRNQSRVYLIVVNYHWNVFDSLPFLREVYFPRFLQLFKHSFDVVYFAPSYRRRLRVIGNSLPSGGFYSYYSLSLAYRLFRKVNEYEYAGYFLMNDDSFIDPLHLNRISLKKSFSEPSEEYSLDTTQWWLWNNRTNSYGVAFKDAYYSAIQQIEQSRLGSKCNLCDPINHRRGFYDFAFITQRDASLYYELSLLFFQNRVFLELAGPTMSWCLSHKAIDSCNHRYWKTVRTCVFLHPVKLTDKANEQLILDHINRRDIGRVANMTYCRVFYITVFPSPTLSSKQTHHHHFRFFFSCACHVISTESRTCTSPFTTRLISNRSPLQHFGHTNPLSRLQYPYILVCTKSEYAVCCSPKHSLW